MHGVHLNVVSFARHEGGRGSGGKKESSSNENNTTSSGSKENVDTKCPTSKTDVDSSSRRNELQKAESDTKLIIDDNFGNNEGVTELAKIHDQDPDEGIDLDKSNRFQVRLIIKYCCD